MRKSLLFIAMFAITLTGFSQLVSNPKMLKGQNLNSVKSTNAVVATLTHSSDVAGANIGYGAPAVLTAVMQFPATTMATYTGNIINKIIIGVNPANFTGDVVVKIWTDTSNFAATPVVSETVAASSLVDGWNEILLSTPYSIDGSEIWVGYTCNSNDYGMYMDDQAAEANGYGDLLCDGTSWANTSAYGASFDHNWHIKAVVDDGVAFDDAGVTAVAVPNWNCELTATEQVVAVVKNLGTADLTTAFDMAYVVNGGTAITVPVPVPLAAGASVDIPFTVDMSADGSYQIDAYTVLTTDGDNNNDTTTVVTANTVPNIVPFTVAFDVTTVDFAGWNNEDVNADGSTWGVLNLGPGAAHSGDIAAVYQYSATNAADDYMYSNCIDLAAGNYKLTFWSKVGDDGAGTAYPENLSVKLGQGQNAAAMTTTIVDLGTITDIVWTEHIANFTVATTGTYNLGFYAYSDANMFYVAVDDVTIETALSVNSISATEINVYPNPTTGVVTITNAENATINVYNQVGGLVRTVNNSNKVDLSDLENGTYIVKITTGTSTIVRNIVLTK